MSGGKVAAVGIPETSEEELAQVAAELREIECQSGWARTTAIGKLIIERFFAGDPEAWWGRKGRNTSLRHLAARADCPLKKTALAEAVGVYALSLQEPHVCQSNRITPSHVAAVLGLETAARRKLLDEAADRGLGVRDLVERVHGVRDSTRSGSSRQVSSRRATLNFLEDAAAKVRKARLLAESMACADNELRSAFMQALSEIEGEIAAVRTTLTKLGRSLPLARTSARGVKTPLVLRERAG